MADNEITTISDIEEDEFVAQAQTNVGFSKEESIIPFIRILQPLSPQLQTTPGALPGMIMNIANGRMFDGKIGVHIVPIMPMWNYTEWTPREDGGGFIKDWEQDEAGWQAKCDEDQKYAYKPMTKDGHVILKARHFFILTLLEDGGFDIALMPFTGTGLKVARSWSTAMANAPKIATSKGMMVPAHFYYVYNLTVEHIKNGQYNWYEPRIKLLVEGDKAVSIMDRPDGKIIWKACIDFRDSLKAGTMKAASQSNEAVAQIPDDGGRF